MQPALHSLAVLNRLYLVRHGEVENPGHVVYADLPGFSLSLIGRAQAEAAARYLALRAPEAVVSSPLDRAMETAAAIGRAVERDVVVDDRLIEWRLSGRWAGVVWEDLPERFPGELEAYLATPYDLPFAPETILEVAERMAAVVEGLEGSAVLVSHQDPVQALRVRLVGGEPKSFLMAKPGHASVITLDRGPGGWQETAHWEPDLPSDPFPPGVSDTRS